MDTQTVTFTITSCQPLQSKSVYALLDIEIVIGGVALGLMGVQARHLAGAAGGTSVHLPTYRAPDGSWLSAVRLPAELIDPMSDAVLEYLIDQGLAVRKSN